MKRIQLAIACLLIIGLGCKKREKVEGVLDTKAKIIRDCVGTYIQTEGAKLYRVCNIDKTDSFANQATVSIKYVKITACSGGFKEMSCYKMPMPDNGIIEVVSIM